MDRIGRENELCDLLNKSHMLALRVAATLQLVEGSNSKQLEPEYVKRGITIAEYFVAEAKRLYLPTPVNAHSDVAMLLMETLRKKGMTEFTRAWLYKNGPHNLRTKQALEPVLNLLLENGWTSKIKLPKKKGVSRHKTLYKLTHEARRYLGM